MHTYGWGRNCFGNLAWVGACALASLPGFARAAATAPLVVPPDGGRIIIETPTAPAKVPLYFSASVDQSVHVGSAEIAGELRVKLRIVQGRPESLTLGLSGDGHVAEVSGANLRDWAVRQGTGEMAGRRFLDLRPLLTEGAPAPRELDVIVRTQLLKPNVPGTTSVLTLTPGDAVGFTSQVSLRPDATLDLRVTSAAGLLPLDPDSGPLLRFHATGDNRLELKLTQRGAAIADAEFPGAQLTGTVNDSARSVEFRLRGQASVRKVGARLRLLSGGAALSEVAAGDGWHVELISAQGGPAYELVFDREGAVTVDLGFVARVTEDGDWQRVAFQMPAGAVVPLRLEGLAPGVEFDPQGDVVPGSTPQGWLGFLPSNGSAALAWKRTRDSGEGTLFFTSAEQSDVRVGAGLLRQMSQISLQVLQGKIAQVRLRLDGPGEILGVQGANIVSWTVRTDTDRRYLEIQLSRPVEGEVSFVVRSQTALGSFPVATEAIRLTPEGALRHSGFLRVANDGAVRLEVADTEGLMQLAPAQFPGAPIEGARQVFAFRFPSATYAYRVLASQIQPEVGVSQVVTYELGETDRVINAALELDVREAPLRDWSLLVPEDYAVVSVQGNDVIDYVAESVASDGRRLLRILFGRAVDGRQLLHVRLEKSQAAGAGEWTLAPLIFPGAKSVRGHVGAVAAPGYRLVPATMEQLVEVPLSYFPKQTPGLQQAWRLREAGWTAALQIEALGQSVQADVFHLYSLKEGVVYGSVLINYFVVGAPANEWRLTVPETVGNIDVVGQNVRRDWRRSGNEVIVSLHQPVLGAATLLVTFEQPMSARGGVIRPGEVHPLDVQSERGFLQVVSPLQVKNQVRSVEGGLLKLEPLELPAELRLLTTSPSLAVYQYTARPFTFEMDVEWYEPGETVDQVVDFARLTSRVARDGQVVTDARFFVKTRGRKALRMVLPEGMKLWEARVDHEAVNARTDGAQTLVPLPPRLNPNEPAEVALRLGQAAGASAGDVRLVAPRMLAPVVISEWSLRGDAGRLLVPGGGNAQLVRPVLTETGFEWIARRADGSVFLLLAAIALAGALLRTRRGWRVPAGLLVGTAAAVLAFGLALDAMVNRRVNLAELTYATSMVSAEQGVVIEVGNLPVWRAMISWGGVIAGSAALMLFVAALVQHWRDGRHVRLLQLSGAVLMSGGILAQHGGAIFFFAAVGAVTFVTLPLRAVWQWLRLRGERRAVEGARAEPDGGASAIATLLAFAAFVGFAAAEAPVARADDRVAVVANTPAQAIVQHWSIRDERLFAELTCTVRGAAGDSFLLLRPPATLTEFRGDGLRVGKVERDGAISYYVSPEREGTFTARVKFELPATAFAQGIPIPTGPAAVQRITIDLDQAGWEFASRAAVQVLPVAGLAADHSGATLVLGPGDGARVELRPKRRDVTTETTQFFAEVANLYLPGPGVVNGRTRVVVRPAQGRVTELELEVPEGFTVGEVSRGPVGAWRFDAQKRRLHVAVEPAQTDVFRFEIETQLGTGALPVALALRPLRVSGAADEVGLLGLAFGDDAQPEGVRADGLSAVSVDDFDATLLPRTREGRALAVLQHVWRYGREDGQVALQAVPVAPEVRVASRQVFSVGDDRLVLAADLNVAITRVGLFRLSFVLPDGLEVEAVSGAALGHWNESSEDGRRIVTLHLTGRTIGEQTFALSLAGAAPGAQADWTVPRLLLREATRQTGELLLVPQKGIRLREVDRVNATQLDPRVAGGAQPGTLAFRLLQDDWVLHLGVEALEPWVTVQALQEVTAREGQTLTRIGLRYRVENAAVKQLRVRLPGLDEAQVRTVRATGSAVSDFIKVADAADIWELRFQRGIAGETDVQIEFQGAAARDAGRETVATPEFIGARQTSLFVAVRGGGRLELEAGELPRGWQRVDWSAVPPPVQDRGDRSVPALCFRVAEPEGALTVVARRHDVADALKLRVTHGELITLFSPGGAALTAVTLNMDVVEKSTLRVRLPQTARLFNTSVNGETVAVVREADAHLFYVSPKTTAERSAVVRVVYSVAETPGRRVELVGPGLSVPLENVVWRVVVPPGFDVSGHSGGLRLREERTAGFFGVEQYRTVVSDKRSADAQHAVAELERANILLQRGQQAEAGEILSRAYNSAALDDASNEDARVQLRSLRTQQAVLGLNTRRQRMYLDNRADAPRNEQLEQAATANPLMQGKVEFNPQDLDQLLLGNSAEENSALRGIAARIVDQQLAAEPAPGAIDVTLPERGRVLTFTRSLQVDGAAPLDLRLVLVPANRTSAWFVAGLLGAIALVAALLLPSRRPIAA